MADFRLWRICHLQFTGRAPSLPPDPVNLRRAIAPPKTLAPSNSVPEQIFSARTAASHAVQGVFRNGPRRSQCHPRLPTQVGHPASTGSFQRRTAFSLPQFLPSKPPTERDAEFALKSASLAPGITRLSAARATAISAYIRRKFAERYWSYNLGLFLLPAHDLECTLFCGQVYHCLIRLHPCKCVHSSSPA
jgi:hypothetical protein